MSRRFGPATLFGRQTSPAGQAVQDFMSTDD